MKKKYLGGILVDTQFGPLYLLNEKLSEWYEHTQRKWNTMERYGGKKAPQKEKSEIFCFETKRKNKIEKCQATMELELELELEWELKMELTLIAWCEYAERPLNMYMCFVASWIGFCWLVPLALFDSLWLAVLKRCLHSGGWSYGRYIKNVCDEGKKCVLLASVWLERGGELARFHIAIGFISDASFPFIWIWSWFCF